VEWYIGLQHTWTVSAGLCGKWFKRYLDAETWAEIQSTYAHFGIKENWEAFFRMLDLFRKLATEVGAQLGYEYPIDLDFEVTEYCSNIREKSKMSGTNQHT